MKGFYIKITNNLLEPKHIKAMGNAVWVYMWCLDKMTSVNEAGVGKILGGKPIKSEEIAKELGLSRRYVSMHLVRLSEAGYINKKRTPFGYQITVNKAKKRFKQTKEMEQNSTSLGTKHDITGNKTGHLLEQNMTNKEDITVDITVDNTVRQGNSVSEGEKLPNWLDKKTWSDWITYKKEKKEKLAPTTIKLQLKELSKDIPNHAEIIEQSIKNGWKGLFPLKNKKNKMDKSTPHTKGKYSDKKDLVFKNVRKKK